MITASGKLTILGGQRIRGVRHYVECVCACGNTKRVLYQSIKYGITVSCGCAQKEKAKTRFRTHGRSGTPLYNRWHWMVDRCHHSKPGTRAFKFYKSKGITVCDRWKKYENFEIDMGESFIKHFTENNGDTQLDRIDSSKGYSPQNCRWLTQTENLRNRVWKVCMVPTCKTLTSSTHQLCGRHYRSQWQKIKHGTITRYDEKLWALS